MATHTPPFPTPDNEAQRLQAVRALGLIGSPPDAHLEALARVAAHTFGVPAAVVSLMEADYQAFLARVGVDVSELTRQESLCAHTLMSPEALLIVEDLSQDARFAAHPLVTGEPELRFYAGAPLRDEQGLPVGTLALLDTRARLEFSPAQRAALQDLAQLAAHTLLNQRRTRELAHLAQTDPVTGLSNRAQFTQTLEVELAHAMRTGEPFTLVYLDLDGFQAISDGFGPGAGDEVLREVAQRLRQQVRLGDVVARLGRDTFGIVMRHGAQDSAEILARRIVKAMAEPITLGSGDVVGVGISVGMAAYTDATESMQELQMQAEAALQEARQHNALRWKMFARVH